MMEPLAAAARCVLVLGLAATAIACQSTYYEEYLAKHPDFDPVLPRQDASLEEVLAVLHAPNEVETIKLEISRLAVFRADAEPWTEIPFEAIRRGSIDLSAEADYVVLVSWACSFDLGLESRATRVSGYYLLPHDRLAAYDHYAFHEQCRAWNEFRAARLDRVATEREAQERIAPGGARLSLTQVSRRGLAYLEAGRLPEARAMLVLGERSYRAAAEKLRAAGRQQALADAQRMRSGLMRALGVEENPAP